MGFIVFLVFFFICAPSIGITIGIISGYVKGKKRKNEYMEAQYTIEDKLREQGFRIEKRVGINAKLYIDNTKKLWAINEWDNSTDVKIYKFSDLIDFELLSDDESLITSASSKALIGGAFAGATGAVIGSAGPRAIQENATLLEIIIRTNDFDHPQYSIEYIKGYSLPKNSPTYTEFFDSAQEVISVLNYIATNNEEKQIQANSSTLSDEDIYDELRKLNQLKNEGIITEEEFEKKKKEMLNL